MNKQTLALVTLLLISLPCGAEVIDGPANVREAPGGKVLFSLNDNIPVESNEQNKDWFHVHLPVYVDEKTAFADPGEPVLNQGVDLFDERGRKLGATLARMKADLFFDEEVHNGRRIVVIEGFTHRKNIRNDSILEPQLAAVLNRGNILSIDTFQEHLKSFHYQEWMPKQGFHGYIQFNQASTDPSPWPRAILFFFDKKLIAVYHGKPVPSKRIAASTTIRDYTMSYVTTVSPELRKKFSTIYYPIIEGAD